MTVQALCPLSGGIPWLVIRGSDDSCGVGRQAGGWMGEKAGSEFLLMNADTNVYQGGEHLPCSPRTG